jgi:hypothetical protein
MMAECADGGTSRARAREAPVYDIPACRSTAWHTHKRIISRDPSNRQEKFRQEFGFSTYKMNSEAAKAHAKVDYPTSAGARSLDAPTAPDDSWGVRIP